MSAENEDILADANDALRAELAAQRTKARRARHVLLAGAYGAVITATVIAACVDVLARHGSLLTMVLALVVIGWAGKEMREATDDPALDAYDDEADAEDEDEEDDDVDDEDETTGVRVADEDAPDEDDARGSGEHAAAKAGAK